MRGGPHFVPWGLDRPMGHAVFRSWPYRAAATNLNGFETVPAENGIIFTWGLGS